MSDLVPPQDEKAESSALGAFLLASGALSGAVAIEGLKPESFSRPRHQRIFSAMLELHTRGDGIDVVTVCGELERTQMLDEAGGPDYVHALPAVVPAVGNWRSYVQRVVATARFRTQYEAARDLMAAAAVGDEGAIADAEGRLGASHETRSRRPSKLERQEALAEIVDRGEEVVWRTPFVALNDRLIGGFRPGQFTLLAGAGSHGKSALLAQMLGHFRRQGAKCALFTNEMEQSEIDLRSVARVSGLKLPRLMLGKLEGGEHDKFVKALKTVGDDFDLVEASGMTADEISFEIRREQWDVIGIDLFNGLPGSAETRDIDRNISVMTACSRQAHCHIFGAQHLSSHRAVGRDYPPEPVQADVRGSRQLWDLANNVLFVYLKESTTEPGMRGNEAVLKLDKARGAMPGKVDAVFDPKRMRFLARDDERGSPLGMAA